MAPVFLLAVLGSLAAVVGQAGGIVTVPESEPNNTFGTADPISFVGPCGEMSGSISVTTDVDYFSFSAPAGSRVWASVDTSTSPLFNDDSVLTLFDTNGTTPIEQDDDDFTATNCGPGGTIPPGTVNPRSSAIAGRLLATGGTYFLQVAPFPDTTVTSYRLTVVVTTSSSAEVESNNTTATANPIVTAGSLVGVRTGNISTIGPPPDVDVYSVFAPAGSTLVVSADGNPERDASGTDVVVDLISTDGTTVVLTADTSANGSASDPPAESFCFNISTTGTYYVRVRTAAGKPSTGTYSLMVAVCGIPFTPTPTATRTATPTVTNTGVVGGPSATPTQTRTPTATVTATFTPQGGGGGGPAPSNIPTLSFPMLAAMGVALATAAFVLLRRT